MYVGAFFHAFPQPFNNEARDLFDRYVNEWHPAKDDEGAALYPYALEIVEDSQYHQPQCVDLLELFDQIFSDEHTAPDLLPLQKLLVALIEDGQRHAWHGRKTPTLGLDACARKGSAKYGKECVYCRYLFPRLVRLLDSVKKAVVEHDDHRPNLYNLLLSRNADLLNPVEERLLLCNLANIDWRALLNLWSVLEYLTKHTTQAGSGSSSFKKTFVDVTDMINSYEEDNGLKDLWRTAIMKFYSKVLGGGNYSLLEAVHFGLKLPATISSFGEVRPISISDWSVVKACGNG